MNVTSKGTLVGVKKFEPQPKKSSNLSYRIQKISHVTQQKAELTRFTQKKWEIPQQMNTNFQYGLKTVKSHIIEPYKLNSLTSANEDNSSLGDSRSKFNKKTSNQTYNASDKKQSNPSSSQYQNPILQQLKSRIKVLSLPKQILQYLKIGDMQKFLIQFEKLENNKEKISQMKAFFKDQEDFYKKLKFIITDNNDSRDFFEDKSFKFFEEIPQLFNRILVEISRKLVKLEAFQQGSKPYLASNTSTKIEENFDKFFKAVYTLAKDKQNDIEEKRKLSRDLRAKSQQIDELKLKIKQMKIEQIQSKSAQNDQSRRVYLQTLQNNQNLKAKLRQFERMAQEKQRQVIELSSRMNIFVEQNKTLKFNSTGLIEKIKKSEKLIQQLNDQIQTLKQQKPTKTFDIQPIQTKPLISQTELQHLRTQLQTKQKQILNFKRINFEQGSKQNDQIRYIRELQERLIQASATQQQDQSKFYLQTSQILEYKDTIEKCRLVKMIGNYTKSHPIQFKLLYKHQSFTQPNFHYFIDNRTNFMILVKLVNNVVIGGFCPYPMAKSSYSKAGFIFNLTSNQLYPLKQDKPCFAYDEYYFTMGNAQIRIRMGDDFVYSSFGIQNEHFNSKGQTISKFLYGYEGQSILRQINFKSFEIYEVKFDY